MALKLRDRTAFAVDPVLIFESKTLIRHGISFLNLFWGFIYSSISIEGMSKTSSQSELNLDWILGLFTSPVSLSNRELRSLLESHWFLIMVDKDSTTAQSALTISFGDPVNQYWYRLWTLLVCDFNSSTIQSEAALPLGVSLLCWGVMVFPPVYGGDLEAGHFPAVDLALFVIGD